MAVIKLVEPYAITQLRKDVRDSMMLAGEQAILLQLYHPGDKDALACPECGDDVYKSPEYDCASCYGTMWAGGVRTAMKIWALFTDHVSAETEGPRGFHEPDAREIQFEAFPLVQEHDIVVRVRQWNADGTPATVHGFYMLQAVQQRSLRTGNRFGQWSWDTVGQKAQLTKLSDSMRAITTYPVLGQTFEESLQLYPATATTPAHLITEPDTKVIYFPFQPAPGGVEPVAPTGGGSEASFTFTQSLPSATWHIQHNLGYEPSVSVMVGNEEVDADVDYPNLNTVLITFSTPQTGTARLT